MKLCALFFVVTAIPASFLAVHLHAAPSPNVSSSASPGRSSSASHALHAHGDAFHAHLRALHRWFTGHDAHAPSKTRGAPSPSDVEGAPLPSSVPAPSTPSQTSVPPVIRYDLARTGIDWHRGLGSVQEKQAFFFCRTGK